MTDDRGESTKQTMRAFGALGSLGFAFVFAILIGFGGGYLLDRWLGTTWIWLVGLLLGIAAAILNVVRTANRFIK
jgi:F0F1-type ATP synthase assembly protein I